MLFHFGLSLPKQLLTRRQVLQRLGISDGEADAVFKDKLQKILFFECPQLDDMLLDELDPLIVAYYDSLERRGSDMTAILTKLTLRTFRPRGDTDDCIDNYANENRDISEHWPKYIEF